MTYKEGLVLGVAMTDAEVMRYVNGCVAAYSGASASTWHFYSDPMQARQNIGAVQDALAECGMIALVGYKGTPVIKQIGT